jgi:hypothetical protein
MVFAAAVVRTGKSGRAYGSLIALPSALFGADSLLPRYFLSKVFSDDERFSFLSTAKHHSFDSHRLGRQLQVSPSIAFQCMRPFRTFDLRFDISAFRNIFDC